MAVYVDDMDAEYGRMKMSHMVADTEAELHQMAAMIGVARRWYQGDHYDVCLSMKRRALELGAIQVTRRQLGIMVVYRRRTGRLPKFSQVSNVDQAFKELMHIHLGKRKNGS